MDDEESGCGRGGMNVVPWGSNVPMGTLMRGLLPRWTGCEENLFDEANRMATRYICTYEE